MRPGVKPDGARLYIAIFGGRDLERGMPPRDDKTKVSTAEAPTIAVRACYGREPGQIARLPFPRAFARGYKKAAEVIRGFEDFERQALGADA